MNDTALVLFSGGQDSATCLVWALSRFRSVETIGFNYKQRHIVELEQRAKFMAELRSSFPDLASRLGEDHLIDLSVLNQISDTALTQERTIAMQRNGLPNTFVPGRNLLFFSFAGTIAYRRELLNLVGGMCETDFSGYPDCRDDTIKALQVCLNLGMGAHFVIHTPLMWITKAQTWELAYSLGGEALVNMIIEHTHTCYLGDRRSRFPWGYGCGTCPACELRKNGYFSFTERVNNALHG